MKPSACLLACLLAPALAQEPESPSAAPCTPAALGKVLAAARDSGALEQRLVGTRWLHFTREGRDFEALVELRGELLPEGAGLACEMRLTAIRGSRAGMGLVERCELDFSGRLLRVHVEELRSAGGSHAAEGALQDGVLVLQVHKDEATEERRVEWSEDALPFGFAAFFLPCLIDQGLPERLAFRTFEGEKLRLRRSPSTHTLTPGVEERAGRRLRKVAVGGDMGWNVLVEEGSCALEELTIDGRTMTAISAEQAAALREAAAAPTPAPPPEGE